MYGTSDVVWHAIPALLGDLAALVQKMYKASKKRFDEDAEFKDRARKAVTQLQGGDPQFVEAWQRICAASRKVEPSHCDSKSPHP